MRVLSGIQATGIVHLGNYFGALKNWVELQNSGHDCYYFIANEHAITLPQEPQKLKENTLSLAATLLAIGIDPNKSTLFIQSQVPGHAQLAWILNCLSPMGHIERMIQFKEKSEDNPEQVNVGLFTYPILQAADILLYKPDVVPVGIDQAQHLELTRFLAHKFNSTYKPLFPEPQTLHTQTLKVVGLDGSAKMSKSKNNYIGLVEDEKTIWKKLATAATDPARVKRTDPGNPFICNIYSLHTFFSSQSDLDWVVEGCRTAKIGCIDCKGRLFQNMNNFLKPIRESYNDWMSKPKELKAILDEGARKASKVADQTISEVYEAIGFY